ncbi:MAG: LysR family transcriptional regulator [Sneathiella sp.]|nr:LysR family transcriptional regulator [Sneathiella sp.]
MELQQIKYFLAVVDFGTFLAASKQVHVTQPTLSAGIRKLEESLNVTLFNRGSRSATLTAAGDVFLAQARQSYDQLRSIKSKLADEPDRIVIGVLKNIHMDHIAEIVEVNRATNPHILIEVVVGSGDEITKMLQEQKVDLIITNDLNASHDFTLLFEEHLSIVVPKRHPFAMYDELALKELSNEPFIERVKCGFWKEVNQAFQDQNIIPCNVFQAENDEFVLSLVAANLGVSIITERVTPYDVSFIRIKDLKIKRSIGICVTPQPMAPHIQALYTTIMELYNSNNGKR